MKTFLKLLLICYLFSMPSLSFAKKNFWKNAADIAQLVLRRVLENSVDKEFRQQQIKNIINLRIDAKSAKREGGEDKDAEKDFKMLLDNIEKLTEINSRSKERISRLEKIIIQKNSKILKRHLSYVDRFDEISIANSGWYKIKASPSLRVRSAPNLEGKKVGSIPNNGKIKVVDVATKLLEINGHVGRWVLVAYKNTTGYVFSGYLVPVGNSPNLSKPTYIGWYTVNAKPFLNIRSTPDVTGRVIGKCKNGSDVQVMKYLSTKLSIGGRYGRWVKIKSKHGDGYVFDAFLSK